MLIYDRGLDLRSPVIHDFFYQNIVYDIKEVGQGGKVRADNRNVFLNE